MRSEHVWHVRPSAGHKGLTVLFPFAIDSNHWCKQVRVLSGLGWSVGAKRQGESPYWQVAVRQIALVL